MPSTNAYVGSQLIPVATSGANTALEDPTLKGLLAYFGHWIKFALDAKLAEQQGPTSSSAITDACPELNRFAWNHNGTFMRPHNRGGASPEMALPGLWVWCESTESTKECATLWYDCDVRTIRINYVFPELQIPLGYAARSGLTETVGRVLRLACKMGRHPTFSYDGSAPGAGLGTLLSILRLDFVRGAHGNMSPVPGSSAQGNGGRAQNEGAIQRFFPAYDATIRVIERIGLWEPAIPEDKLGDSLITIEAGDNTADTIELMQRVLIAPDDTP